MEVARGKKPEKWDFSETAGSSMGLDALRWVLGHLWHLLKHRKHPSFYINLKYIGLNPSEKLLVERLYVYPAIQRWRYSYFYHAWHFCMQMKLFLPEFPYLIVSLQTKHGAVPGVSTFLKNPMLIPSFSCSQSHLKLFLMFFQLF